MLGYGNIFALLSSDGRNYTWCYTAAQWITVCFVAVIPWRIELDASDGNDSIRCVASGVSRSYNLN
jgi:hypothetical protein